MKSISEIIVRETIKKRYSMTHKGHYGRVTLVGGNAQYGGAIILASEAAVQSGAGLVTTITSKANHTSLHARLPEAMLIDWEDEWSVKENLSQADVIVVGPGLGLEKESLSLLKMVLANLKMNQICIVDGSAITLIGENRLALPKRGELIFTPHEKEWERLSGLPITKQNISRNRTAKGQLPGAVILKKHRTEVYLDTEVWQNPLGCPAMATGGMGDVLAGMLAGFMAQFQPFNQALLSAVYVHSYIGERIGKDHYVALPSAVTREISRVMKELEGID